MKKRLMPAISAGLLLLFVSIAAPAEIQTKAIDYQDGDVRLQGFLAWDDAVPGKRPGVLVVHEWWGLNDYVQERARMLAKLGYVAFAADMYGKGKVTEHPKEAGEWASQITANIGAWQKRALAGVKALRDQESLVDPQQVAAIGYCFGGSTVMELAYAGADLAGVVSFHGSLPVATQEQLKNIKTKILVAHGAADSFTPPERIAKFQAALEAANADWQMVYYGEARHGFTNPKAGTSGAGNVQYNEKADRRSWQAMRDFFGEIFAK